MKITHISAQVKNPDRVNVSVDGEYRFSLDIAQVVDLGVKVGQEIDNDKLAELQEQSEFGKLYARTLEHCLTRPHSEREMREYLYKKVHAKTRTAQGAFIQKPTAPSATVAERVIARLIERGHVDDTKFARYWVEHRNVSKGASQTKLRAELRAKGIESSVIDDALRMTERSDAGEIRKIIAKKQKRYPDERKLIHYLQRQGFRYDDIREALSDDE